MVSFTKKEIAVRPSVGQRLLDQRLRLELTLQQLAQRCNIQSRYLQALEDGEYGKLPGEVYAKSFLRTYASQLGLPTDDIIRQYLGERAIFKKTVGMHHDEFTRPVEKVSWVQLLATPKLIRIGAGSALALIVALYLGSRVSGVLSAPTLVVESPAVDLVTTETTIRIEGLAGTGASLSINGQAVVAAEDGSFAEMVDLQRGMNTIEITAKKKHSQQTTVRRQVVVVEPEGVVAGVEHSPSLIQ